MGNTAARVCRILREGGISRFYQSVRDWLRFHPPLFEPRLRVRAWFARRLDGSIADPFKIIQVDPERITRVSRFKNRRAVGDVRGGDWDYSSERFENHTVYKGFHERFVEGKPWEETTYYIDSVEAIDERGHKYGCWSRQEFLETRCSYLDQLYESIRKDGYKRQSEIETENRALHRNTRLGSQKSFHEIMVSIGRDGEFLFDSGKHRLAIAKLLDIETIPVQVVVRHAEWQAIRRRVNRDPQNHTEFHTHPDLQDILDGEADR